MACRQRGDVSVDLLREVPLQVWVDHVVLFGDVIPARLVFPGGGGPCRPPRTNRGSLLPKYRRHHRTIDSARLLLHSVLHPDGLNTDQSEENYFGKQTKRCGHHRRVPRHQRRPCQSVSGPELPRRRNSALDRAVGRRRPAGRVGRHR